jgi:ribosomal-protein-alanine N-acetyltransferase
MNALWKAVPGDASRRLSAMAIADLDAVMTLEAGSYAFPWTRGNFLDSLAAGYVARTLRLRGARELIGYIVAMGGADEMHLLNITVAERHRCQGHAAFMIEQLVERCRRDAAQHLWLEVRESNAGARLAYQRLGFTQRGVRPGYYPAAQGTRESAIVMSRAIDLAAASGTRDALD